MSDQSLARIVGVLPINIVKPNLENVTEHAGNEIIVPESSMCKVGCVNEAIRYEELVSPVIQHDGFVSRIRCALRLGQIHDDRELGILRRYVHLIVDAKGS